MSSRNTTCLVASVIVGACLAAVGAEAGTRHHQHRHYRAGGARPHAFQHGMASWYGPGFQGRRTASGERFNTGALTAAHPSLAFGTRVRVLNARSGRSIVVRINDRGPFARGRIIDLSRASAQAIGISGAAAVSLVPLTRVR